MEADEKIFGLGPFESQAEVDIAQALLDRLPPNKYCNFGSSVLFIMTDEDLVCFSLQVGQVDAKGGYTKTQSVLMFQQMRAYMREDYLTPNVKREKISKLAGAMIDGATPTQIVKLATPFDYKSVEWLY